MSEKHYKSRHRVVRMDWTKDQIRALRVHLNLTQREMADELEVRQQTISEWETGLHQPHRSTMKVLSMLAERAAFAYAFTPKPPDAAPDSMESS